MAATNVLDYMACINTGTREVILWQRKLIRHSHTLSKVFLQLNLQVFDRKAEEKIVVSGQTVCLHPHETVRYVDAQLSV